MSTDGITRENRHVGAGDLEVRGLGVRLDRGFVVEDVTFTAKMGELVAVVGPNGAGKTTLLEAIAGLRPTARGDVCFGGDVLRTFADRSRVLAYMPDEATLPEEASLATVLGFTRKTTAVDRFALTSLLNRGVASLSRGETKRAWLALTASYEKPVMVLDEPFGAFDPLQLDEVLEGLRAFLEGRRTAIVSIHQLATAERVADRVVMLAGGSMVAEGTLDEVRARAGRPEGSLEEAFRALLEGAANAPA